MATTMTDHGGIPQWTIASTVLNWNIAPSWWALLFVGAIFVAQYRAWRDAANQNATVEPAPSPPVQKFFVSTPDPDELVRLVAENADAIKVHQAQTERFKNPKRMADFRAWLEKGTEAIAEARQLAETVPENPDSPNLDRQWLHPVTRWHQAAKAQALNLFPDKPKEAAEIQVAMFVPFGKNPSPERVEDYRQRILNGYETFLGAWQKWMQEYDESMTPEAKRIEAEFVAQRAARLAEREANRADQKARQLARRKAERPEHLATLIDLLQRREDYWGDQTKLTQPGVERLSDWAKKVKQAIQRVYWDDERLIVTLGWVVERERPDKLRAPGMSDTMQINHSGSLQNMTDAYLTATEATLQFMRERGDLA